MISKSPDPGIVTLSVKLYQALVIAYPTPFQKEYGLQMTQIFRDCCLRAVRQGGMDGMFKLWVITLIDLLRSVLAEHIQKEADMKKDDFVRLGGWALMVGAIAFLPGVIGMLFDSQYTIDWDSPSLQVAAFACFWAPALLAVGMLGLRARYKIGGGVLLFGAVVGGLLVIVGTLVQFLTTDYSVSETYFYVWAWGVALLYACLSFFGILALIQRPLPRWNALPLLAGAWIPLLVLLARAIGASDEQAPLFVIPGLIVMTIAQIILGYILQADAFGKQPLA